MPEGYMQDAAGRLVPVAQVREIDKARDELVMEKVAKIKTMRGDLAKLKRELMDDIEAFVALSGERYGAKVGGNKGNVTLTSYDGRFRLTRAMAERLIFGEQLQAAKALIDECLRDWTEGARSEVQTLIDSAFQVDKEGNISTSRILGLRRLDIKDDRWLRAMQAIGDSVMVLGTKAYIRAYERDPDGKYVPIPLDMATV